MLDVLQKNLARAERDNDLIYHQDVPASSAISPIQEVVMVQCNVPPGLLDPKSIIGSDHILFGDMLGWGAREAVSTSRYVWTKVFNFMVCDTDIYNDTKQSLVKECITDVAQKLDDEADRFVQTSWLSLPSIDARYRTLRSLNLPSSLEALERPIGLPPSLLKKAEEVRLEQGPERIETYLDDVQRLARRVMAVLDEV